MSSRTFGLSFAALLALLFLAGCGNNTLNPFCGSARPAPLIGSLAPSSVTFAQVQQGVLVTVNGSNFVAASEAVINGKVLSANVLTDKKLTVKLTTGEISGPGAVNVTVRTPSGNSENLGCTSGGTSSALVLTVN
jgi:hypothetical protein